jgi:hypothetical protein
MVLNPFITLYDPSDGICHLGHSKLLSNTYSRAAIEWDISAVVNNLVEP